MAELSEITAIYVKNRAQFYEVLLPRIPHAGLRRHLTEAVQRDAQPADAAMLPGDLPEDSFLRALALRDWLKKPSYGSALGKTTISFGEALTRSIAAEDVGLALYSRLEELIPGDHPDLAERIGYHRAVLEALLTLEDALRYHRLAR